MTGRIDRRRAAAVLLALALRIFVGALAFAATAAHAQCNPNLQCCNTAPHGGTPRCGQSDATSQPQSQDVGAGNPVDIVTGNKYQQEADLPALPGVLGLELVRHYNSVHTDAGALGRGWRLSYHARLAAGLNALRIVQGDGASLHFTRGIVEPDTFWGDAQLGKVTRDRSGLEYRYTWHWPDGRQLRFNQQGQLTSIQAAGREAVSFLYGPDGHLIHITDPQGRRLDFHYPRGSHRISAIATPVGRYAYEYDGDRLTRTTLPDGTRRLYHYEDKRHPSHLTGISVQGSDGQAQRIATWAYDDQGRAISSVKGDGQQNIERVSFERKRSDDGGTVILTNSLGQTTRYTWKAIAYRERIVEAVGAGCASCGETNVRYAYDRQGRLIEATKLDDQAQPIEGTRHTFDLYGRTRRTSRVVYKDGKPQPEQWLVRYEYGLNGQPTLIARPSVIAGKEHRIRIEYNDAGQPTRITEDGYSPIENKGEPAQDGWPISRSTTYAYSRIGGRSVLTQIDGALPNGPNGTPQDFDITRYEWDPTGSFVTAITYPGNSRVNVQRQQETGRISAVTRNADASVQRVSYTYTAAGKVQQHIHEALTPDGAAVLASRTTRVDHDALGHPNRITWPDQHQEQLPALVGKLDAATLSQALPPLQVTYGEPGSVAQAQPLKLEAGGRQAQRLIDDFNRVVALRNPDQGWQTAAYDLADRLVEVRDPRGARSMASFDVAGRLTQVRRELPGQPVALTKYAWQGHLLREARLLVDDRVQHVTQYEYSPLGFINHHRVEIHTGAAPIRLTQTYHYDETGKLMSRELPSGARVAYRYVAGGSAHGQPAALDLVRWPAWLDPLMVRLPESWQRKTRLAELEVATNRLAEPGQRRSTSNDARPDPWPGLHESAPGDNFDAAHLPHTLQTERGNFNLVWNAAGQLVELKDRASGKTVATYTYDALGRRASKTTADGREYYLYNGNELVAVANHQGRVRSEYLYQGYQPVAWLMDATAYRLRTDHRGAVLAAVPASSTSGSPAWESSIDAWGAVRSGAGPDPKLRLVGQYADEETGLSYHVARYYDPKRGRFISPDPAGVADSIDNSTPAALLLDTTAYAGGQPLEYFDPDGAARIRYYAITTGANGRALGTTQGFTRARWAFIVDDIQSGGDGSALGQMRNRYASNGTGLLFDANGNFLANGQSTATWNGGGGTPNSFAQHYGNNLISIAQFTIENMDDDDATALIASYIEADRQQVFGNGCPARSALLPAIRFAPGEADINVARQVEPAQPGTNGNQANRQRILNCNRPSRISLNYADDEERRRIEKYEAAAELQESPPTSAIYRDCSNNHGCRSNTDITVNGHTYYASYGRTQFVSETFLNTLIESVINNQAVTAAQRTQLRLDQAVTLPNGTRGTMADMVRIARSRAQAAGGYFRDFRRQVWNRLDGPAGGCDMELDDATTARRISSDYRFDAGGVHRHAGLRCQRPCEN